MPATFSKVTSRSFWAYTLALLRPKVSGEPPPIIQRSISTSPTASEATNRIDRRLAPTVLKADSSSPPWKSAPTADLSRSCRPAIFFQTDARRAEGDGLRMFAARIGAGGEVGGDDLAANVGAIDLHLLQTDAVAVPAGVEDLDEFAVLQADVVGFAIAEPRRARQAATESSNEPRKEPAPPSA